MTSLDLIKSFLAVKEIAIAGVSRNPQKSGNAAYKGLKSAGYTLFPVNPLMDAYDNDVCWHSVIQLEGKTSALLLVVPPDQSLQILPEALEAGIKTIWFQPGSESPATAEFCQKHKMDYIEKQCILMFAEPMHSFHKFHRFVNKVLGKYPK